MVCIYVRTYVRTKRVDRLKTEKRCIILRKTFNVILLLLLLLLRIFLSFSLLLFFFSTKDVKR